MTKAYLVTALLSVTLLFSCSKKDSTSTTPPPAANAGPLFTSARTVIQANCAVSGCHTGSAPQSGINFSNDNDIVAKQARIKVRAVDQAGTANQMPLPPRAALSSADQQKIVAWINAGGNATN